MFDSSHTFYGTDYQLHQIPHGRDEEFHVHEVSFHDAVNGGYRLRVVCDIPGDTAKNPTAACAARRGQDVQLLIRRQFPNGKRLLETRISGIIQRVDRTLDQEKRPVFVITIIPAYSLLADDMGGGCWQKKSYKDVLVTVLANALARIGKSPRMVDHTRLSGQYPVIDHIVRHPGQSLLDFAQYLMGQTGINAYFRHRPGEVETLVLTDHNDGFVDLEYHLEDDSVLLPMWCDLNADAHERIIDVDYTSSAGPSTVEVQGFDIRSLSDTPVTTTYSCDGGLHTRAAFVSHARMNEEESAQQCLERQAKLTAEFLTTGRNMLHLETTFSGSLAGRRFKAKLDGLTEREYVIMSMSAQGRRYAESGPHSEHPDDYRNTITVVPTSSETGDPVTIRAASNLVERALPGIYRAEIVAIENDPVDVNESLRCRIKYTWDACGGEEKTTYVSVLQQGAGTHGGMHWIPRAGDRCFVAFIGGNPERPIILGFAYDSVNKPPVMGPTRKALPEASSWLGWNYGSIGDKSRYNMFCMDVTAGSELMYFHAPHNWLQQVGNDHTVQIARNSDYRIGGWLHEDIGENREIHIHKDKIERIDGKYQRTSGGGGTSHCTGTYEEFYDPPGEFRKTHYRIPRILEFQQNLDVECHVRRKERILQGGDHKDIFEGDRVTRVHRGNWNAKINGNFIVDADHVKIGSGGRITGGSGPASGGGLSLGPATTLSGPASVSIESGSTNVAARPDGVTISGPSARMEDRMGGSAALSNGNYVVDVPQGITFKCGATTLQLTPQGLFVNGQQLVLQGTRTEIQTASFDVIGPDSET